jgi:hypothetical protein
MHIKIICGKISGSASKSYENEIRKINERVLANCG